MFYRPGVDDHGLPHNPFKAIVSPRPIGWISTCDAEGRANLAPYSFFNGISDDPPMVMFCVSGPKVGIDEEKDSLVNIRQTGEFCVNFVAKALSEAMNISTGHYPHGDDEFFRAGLEKGPSNQISVPFVQTAPAAFECKLFQLVDLPGTSTMVIGEVVGIHIDAKHIRDGKLDVTSYQPLARLGYQDYTAVKDVFSINRPK
ncbi:MAG: flavin reductase family protein [Rhodobacteraceae bacterium]|nr:flavin reductase family protein [Paracoccaceae bacterium]